MRAVFDFARHEGRSPEHPKEHGKGQKERDQELETAVPVAEGIGQKTAIPSWGGQTARQPR